ncbi:GNAT family N-acetyltransferase [Puia sp. P3]|uniref:GNAT family N-acetyltransferase n=1 Tax=Puia sp. P3 TaxID=3423952 RepID=UPI003D66DE7A
MIKICTKEDIDELIRVLLQSYRENYLYLWYDGGEAYMQASFGADRLTGELADPNAVFFMVYDGTQPVGVIKLNIDSPLYNYPAGTTLELERIYFVKEASGKGLGTAAINFITNFAREKNKSIIWLKAMDSSAAVGFYKNRGFRITGETWLSYPAMKEEYRRMVIMVLDLSGSSEPGSGAAGGVRDTQ